MTELAAKCLSELVVFAISAMMIPAGQNETFVYPHEDASQCFKLVRTEGGFDIFQLVNGKVEPAGSIKIDKDKHVYVVTHGTRTESVDLSEFQKALRPFDKAPEQKIVFNGATVKVWADSVVARSEGVFKEYRPILLTIDDTATAVKNGLVTTRPVSATTNPSGAATQPVQPAPGTRPTASTMPST